MTTGTGAGEAVYFLRKAAIRALPGRGWPFRSTESLTAGSCKTQSIGSETFCWGRSGFRRPAREMSAEIENRSFRGGELAKGWNAGFGDDEHTEELRDPRGPWVRSSSPESASSEGTFWWQTSCTV